MKRALALSLAVSILGGCPQDPVTVGFPMRDYFPVENDRAWTFSNMDQELDYVIEGTMDATDVRELEDGTRYVVVHYETRCIEGVEECGAGFLYDIYMTLNALSADGSLQGVFIVGYEDPADGQVIFDVPLRLASTRMGRGEDVSTAGVDGHTFTSSFFDLEKDGTIGRDGEEIAAELGCDQQVGVEWECVHMVVESDPPGHWLAGDWWATPGWNVVAWKRTNDEGKWRAIDADSTLPETE